MRLTFGWDRKKNQVPLKISHTEPNAADLLSQRIGEVVQSLTPQQQLVIVCVGTDRSTGDSLGPLVGTYLRRKHEGFHIYGTLDQPVHAMNLNETLDQIAMTFRNPYIIAVDACLGQLSSVGNIQFCDGPVKPGAGVNKELPPVGDVHITGVVNVGGFMEYFVLQNTRLSLVFEMAEVITSALYRGMLMAPRAAATSGKLD